MRLTRTTAHAAIAALALSLCACVDNSEQPYPLPAEETATPTTLAGHPLTLSKEDYARRVSKTKVTCASPNFQVRTPGGQEQWTQLVTLTISQASPYTDQVRFEFASVVPFDEQGEIPPFTMELVNRQGNSYTYVYRGNGDFSAAVDTPAGYHVDVTDKLHAEQAVEEDALKVPLLAGFVSLENALEKVELRVKGTKDTATCVALSGHSVGLTQS